jgi:hypothetical protein
MLSCKQVSMLLSQAQERSLGWAEWCALNFHLMLCDGCVNFSRQLDAIRAAIKRYRDYDEGH